MTKTRNLAVAEVLPAFKIYMYNILIFDIVCNQCSNNEYFFLMYMFRLYRECTFECNIILNIICTYIMRLYIYVSFEEQDVNCRFMSVIRGQEICASLRAIFFNFVLKSHMTSTRTNRDLR